MQFSGQGRQDGSHNCGALKPELTERHLPRSGPVELRRAAPHRLPAMSFWPGPPGRCLLPQTDFLKIATSNFEQRDNHCQLLKPIFTLSSFPLPVLLPQLSIIFLPSIITALQVASFHIHRYTVFPSTPRQKLSTMDDQVKSLLGWINGKFSELPSNQRLCMSSLVLLVVCDNNLSYRHVFYISCWTQRTPDAADQVWT